MVDLLAEKGEPRDFKLEAELRELQRLTALRKLLEPAAEIFQEMAPKGCHGECADPIKIGNLGLTCCTFYANHEHYSATLRLEMVQRNLVAAAREKYRRPAERREIEGSELQARYYRDFTGTYIGRKIDLRSDEGPPPPTTTPLTTALSRLPAAAFELDPDNLAETLKKLA